MARIRTVGLVVKRDRPRAVRLARRMTAWLARRGLRVLVDDQAGLAGADRFDNTIVGRHVGLNTAGTIVRTDDNHLVVTVGLKDVLVVHTPEATLVANKHDEEAIREIVKQLETRGWSDYL